MNAPVKPPLTSAEARACVQRHFGAGGERYAVLFEVRNGTAWRADRSVDAVVMSLWPSLGMELWGMEIKVGRGDWRRELARPAKASAVFDYFDRWFLVAPADVAKPEEIPEPWGWFVPERGRLTQMRPAARNAAAKPVDRHFLAALLRRAAKTDDGFVSAAVQAALDEQWQRLEADTEQRALSKLGDLRKDAEQWAKLREALKQKPDDYIYTPEAIEAVRLLMQLGLGKSYGAIRALIDEVARSNERLQKVAAEFGLNKPPRARR